MSPLLPYQLEEIARSKEIRAKKKPIKASLEHYRQNPGKYHRIVEPEKLNWDEHLDAVGLKIAGCRANRKPIPGDWDYKTKAQIEEAKKVHEEEIKEAKAEGPEKVEAA
jgi:hypothetical protein